MKDTPILFTPENAQKSHDESKTNTRRLTGLDEINKEPDRWRVQYLSDSGALVMERGYQPGGLHEEWFGQCRWGGKGDRIWVREAFTYFEYQEPAKPRKYVRFEDLTPRQQASTIEQASHIGEDYLVYKGGGAMRSLSEWIYPHPIYEHCIGRFGKTIPAIHMPEWACRTWLDLLEVRVERLRDISEDDAKAEGCRPGDWEYENAEGSLTCLESFRCLWESIHGPGSWDLNPWVWVLSFRKIESKADARTRQENE